MEKRENFIGKYFIKEILITLISIITIIYAWIFFNEKFEFFCGNSQGSEYYQIYGVFGDYVGGILGTILTAITLVFVYLTYTSQKNELKLQRQLIAQQQFESTFFSMLNVHRELKNNLKYSHPYFEKFGLDVLKYINDEYKRNFLIINGTYNGEENLYSENLEIKKNIQEYKNDEFSLEKSKIHFSYKLVFYNFQNSISHYCRNVYHILKYIRENEKNETLGKDQKKYKNYANIFQSQLNVDEQFLLFYNFIHFNKETKDEMFWTINLVNNYKFLENIGIENLILKKHEEFYDFVIKGSDRKIVKK